MDHDVALSDVVINANSINAQAILRQLELPHSFDAALAGLGRLVSEMSTHRSDDRKAKLCVQSAKIVFCMCCKT